MNDHFDLLIVGAGHAGAATATTLRQHGFAGTIAIVGEEPDLPYERPPLSKEYLSGEKTFERILIHSATAWAKRRISLLTGRRVVAVDPVAHQVTLADGGTLGYATLVWAAGGHPRRLAGAGHNLAGVHVVRTRADADRIMAELPATTRVVVIGGGYIGLEAAAVLAKLGKQVTVLEARDRVLARVAGEPLSRFFEAEHRRHGVEIRLGTKLERIEVRDGHAAGVRLADGTFIAAELVIVGIGIIPAVEPLREAGAETSNGVAVDEHCRTTLPDIYAIGDCALHANPFAAGLPIRLESVQNANDMAATVARAVIGDPRPYHAVPWFWSNQYDLRLQTIGLSNGHDQAVLRGDPSSRSFSLIYLKQGRIVALDCVNAVKDYVQGRPLVLSGSLLDPMRLADTSISLKDLASVGPAGNEPTVVGAIGAGGLTATCR